MIVDLQKLPKNVYNKLPMSIKVFKNNYELSELPIRIQNLISSYFNNKSEITYKQGFDIKPKISMYNDLDVIDKIPDLIIDRLKNFLLISINNYPFNISIGCKLKNYIQNKDTLASQSLINAELNNIINVLKADIGHNIILVKKEINQVNIDSFVEYNLKIIIKINNQQYKINFNI